MRLAAHATITVINPGMRRKLRKMPKIKGAKEIFIVI